MGAQDTSAVRRCLFQLKDTRAYLFDSAGQSTETTQNFIPRYLQVIQESKFVLCPRGIGPASIRLFETLKCGRVPVVISDAWVPPDGPSWADCVIRVPENRISTIPGLLKEREVDAERMGCAARREWEMWFAEDVAFHRIVDLCLEIRALRKTPELVARWLPYLQLLRPFHFRHVVASPLARRLIGGLT